MMVRLPLYDAFAARDVFACECEMFDDHCRSHGRPGDAS
jgi:hypothetical protein